MRRLQIRFSDISLIDPKNNISQMRRLPIRFTVSDEKVANLNLDSIQRTISQMRRLPIWIHILTRQRNTFASQVEEIDEILEMKVTHRKNLTRREKKFG